MVAPTRFPAGVSTQSSQQTLGMFPFPDPTDAAMDFEEFFQYVAGDWTVTNTTSHQTIGLVAGAYGIISTVGGGSSVTADIGAIQTNPLNFNLPNNPNGSSLNPSQQAWFYTAVKATTALNDLLVVGVSSSNATAAPTDGIYFQKAAASAAITFVVRKSSSSLAATAYSTGSTTVATLADATWIRLGWYYDGNGYIKVFVNDAMVCLVDVGGSTGTAVATFPKATALGMGFACKAAATAPTTADLVCDFMMTAQSPRPY
jgi:hypothetical protein